MQEMQQKKAEGLAKYLLIKLEPFVRGNVADYKQMMTTEAEDLIDSPGGPSLLTLIGYIYEQEAKQHMCGFLGIEGFFATLAEKGHLIGATVSAVTDAVKLQSTLNEMEQSEHSEHLQSKAMALGLSTILKLGKLEIESVVRAVCEMVLLDKQTEKKTLKKRAKGLLALYVNCVRPCLVDSLEYGGAEERYTKRLASGQRKKAVMPTRHSRNITWRRL